MSRRWPDKAEQGERLHVVGARVERSLKRAIEAHVAAEGGKVSHWLRGLAIAALQEKARASSPSDRRS